MAGYYSSQDSQVYAAMLLIESGAVSQKWLYAKTYNFTGKSIFFGFL